jgi:hypothetical protein
MDNYLVSVTGVSADDLWALGYSDSPSGAHHYLPLAEHWDGSAWTIVPTPQSVGSTINSAHATAENDVWAVQYGLVRHGVTTETSYDALGRDELEHRLQSERHPSINLSKGRLRHSR